MNHKKFTYREYRKLLDDERVQEIKINIDSSVVIYKSVKVNGRYKVVKVRVKKYGKLTTKDMKNLIRQIDKNLVKNDIETMSRVKINNIETAEGYRLTSILNPDISIIPLINVRKCIVKEIDLLI